MPLVFDQLAVFLAVQAHVLAILAILPALQHFRPLWGCAVLMLASLAIPLACVVTARRSGGELSARAYMLAGAALLLVDLGLLLVLPASRIGSPEAWVWGTSGVTVLICAAWRSARDVLLLDLAVTVLALVLMLPHMGSADLDAFHVVLTLSSTTIPALAAAQYVGQYIQALRQREAALAQQVVVQTRIESAEIVRRDSQRRLHAVQAELIPLLAGIASGELAIDNPSVSVHARKLGDVLRRELVETRIGLWLLDTSTTPEADAADDWPGVVLLDPQALLARLRDTDRAALSVLLGTLRGFGGWDRVSVGLTDAEDDVIGPNISARLTVIATGRDDATAIRAVRDPGVEAAAARLPVAVSLEPAGILVADGDVRLGSSLVGA